MYATDDNSDAIHITSTYHTHDNFMLQHVNIKYTHIV